MEKCEKRVALLNDILYNTFCQQELGQTRVVVKECWPVGQAVKTPPFHGGNTGSNPVRVTMED